MDSLRGHPIPSGALSWLRLCVVAALALAALAAIAPSQASACNRVAAPGGSDGAAGTAAAPYATFGKLAHWLAPGQTGCLRAGTYRENVEVNANGAPGAPITIQSYPGERTTYLGRLTTDRTSSYLTFRTWSSTGRPRRATEARSSQAPPSRGEHRVIGNEVTNWHTAICFAVGNESFGRAPRVVIKRNRIHDCGQLPPTNRQHGIYLHSPCCAQVTDNWVYDNADTGIQMFPDADGNHIARNVVYGNGDNISFGGDTKDGVCASSNNNLVERNVLAHPKVKENVGSWSGCGKPGTGNVLRENCIWPATFEGTKGHSLMNNFHVDPQFVNAAAKDFRIVPGTPCAALVSEPGVAHTGAGSAKKRGKRALTLRSNRRSVRVGRRILLSGRVQRHHPARPCAGRDPGARPRWLERRAQGAHRVQPALPPRGASARPPRRAAGACQGPAFAARERPAPAGPAGGRRPLENPARAGAPVSLVPGAPWGAVAVRGTELLAADAVLPEHLSRGHKGPLGHRVVGLVWILCARDRPRDAVREPPVAEIQLELRKLADPPAVQHRAQQPVVGDVVVEHPRDDVDEHSRVPRCPALQDGSGSRRGGASCWS